MNRKHISWIAVSISILASCFWAFWGIIENFHEGWYFDSFLQNIGLMFLQYLSPMLILILLNLLSIRYHKLGAITFLVTGIFLYFFTGNLVLSIPFVIVTLLFWFGKTDNKKWQYRLALILPLLTLVVFSIEPIYRVSRRLNDKDFKAQIIEGNGITLVWAPQGPGWPDDGMDWYKADSICKYLEEDGSSLASEPQYIWRLPTVEEAVRSMQRHGENCMGFMNEKGKPEYQVKPDKETPLWNPNSKIIYWWTSTEIDSTYAYIIV